MGQAQFCLKLDEFMDAIRAPCEKFGTKEFDQNVLLQMFNSTFKTSIDDGKTMGHR